MAFIPNTEYFICDICNKKMHYRGIGSHLTRIHKITLKEYYDTYMKQKDEGYCKYCGRLTNFSNSLIKGYYLFCSTSCGRLNKALDKEFNKSVGKKISENWKNKSDEEKNDIINRRTFTYNSKSNDEKQQIKNKISNGIKQIWEQRDEEEKNKCLKGLYVYNESYKLLDEEEKLNKRKNISIALKTHYKNETESEKQDRINIQKEVWNNKSEDYKQQVSNRNSEISKNFWNSISDEERSKLGKQITERNLQMWKSMTPEEKLERCKAISNGCKNRKYIKNKISLVEQDFYNFLINHNISFIFQYNEDSRYPYHCDFYLPKYDLFIELNVFWHHGGKIFYITDIDCINQLNKWKEKAKTSKSYKEAINTWTKRDVEKRNTAKNNNLNYIELFSIDDINKCKEKLLKYGI